MIVYDHIYVKKDFFVEEILWNICGAKESIKHVLDCIIKQWKHFLRNIFIDGLYIALKLIEDQSLVE